jgi:outer membrane protein TolC
MMSIVFSSPQLRPSAASAAEKLDPSLTQIEQRLEEEAKTPPSELSSLTYLRAVGELPARTVSPREMKVERILTLDECLQSAFANSNEVAKARERILKVGGSRYIANSRFLPTIELISQYEHFRNFDSVNTTDDAHSIGAKITQRILEFGKDNPIDVSFREEQRDELFSYENTVADVFWRVRKAFFIIKLKEQQVRTRQELLKQFEKQYETKKVRMEEHNLSTKMQVLTARLNVLEERSAINTLEREQFNSKVDLLRLIGLPIGADEVEFEGQMDRFGLDEFDMDGMIRLALAQSTQVALAEAHVAEQQRFVHQLRYEYTPDLRLSGGYQGEDGKVGADLLNEGDTWGLDVFGQPKVPGLKEERTRSLGIYGNEVRVDGPDPGWFAGLQLRIPITEGGERRGKQIQAKAWLRHYIADLEDQKDRVELGVRKEYKMLTEQKFLVDLKQTEVDIENERLAIQTERRDLGQIDDDALERFREDFFLSQNSLLGVQGELIERQEDLRLAIRFFK